MVKDRAYPRYVPQILMRDDPCVEGREFQFGEHRAEKRVGAADRPLDDRDADAGARARELRGMVVDADDETFARKTG